ncbi:phosphotransferase [Paenibacillus sp.]|uniref:phosphotransferase enzyme family protein n=1 Tax=Paenibacillus sp. TaxID=58172 RepID=UPI0028119A4B|nr:phosphotransferase [Paenibacillus sp.]
MTEATKRRWAEEVAAELNRRFGRAVTELTEIDLGWLNAKWKAETSEGPLFVKVYHPDRYRLHERPERRRAIETTLRLQRGLHEAGAACPAVYAHEGRLLLETPSGLLFAVHDWTDGATVRAGCMSEAQMYELGLATGRMHEWLRSAAPLEQPVWTPDKLAYLTSWESNRENASAAGDEAVLEWLSRSRSVVERLDFRSFDEAPIGWLHWDLWTDNLLYRGPKLAGIVDFDRMTFAYPEIDAARAVLSGALSDGRMRTDAVRAFLDGYRERTAAPRGMLPRAMRMIYLIESAWWYRTEIRVQSELRQLLGRFIEEMHWIEAHWETLSDELEAE